MLRILSIRTSEKLSPEQKKTSCSSEPSACQHQKVWFISTDMDQNLQNLTEPSPSEPRSSSTGSEPNSAPSCALRSLSLPSSPRQSWIRFRNKIHSSTVRVLQGSMVSGSGLRGSAHFCPPVAAETRRLDAALRSHRLDDGAGQLAGILLYSGAGSGRRVTPG